MHQQPPRHWIDDAEFKTYSDGVNPMSKSKDTKKMAKKETDKTPTEKKEAKQLKKEEKKRL